MSFNFNVKIKKGEQVINEEPVMESKCPKELKVKCHFGEKENNSDLPINKYDQNGRCIYTKYIDPDGKIREENIDRDKYGNIIHVKDESGDECWSKYDKRGNEIYFKHDNEERFYEYDKENTLVSTQTTYHI